MTNVTQPLITPTPKGILDPHTGRPIGADDPSFGKAVVSIVQIHSAKIRSINVTCFRLAKVPHAAR